MTIQPWFFDWVRSGLDFDAPPYESCSPNLQTLRVYLDARWPGGQNLGCESDRPIRQGVTQSEHSWGAAWDWRYPAGVRALNGDVDPGALERERTEIAWWAVEFSFELGICAIHDYLGDRIWRAGRTADITDAHGSWWRKQFGAGGGMGESWAHYFHFVTTFDMFQNATPVADRLPKPPPDEEEDVLDIIQKPVGDWAQDWFPWLGCFDSGAVRSTTGNDMEPRRRFQPAPGEREFPITDEGQYRRLCHQFGIQLTLEKPG